MIRLLKRLLMSLGLLALSSVAISSPTGATIPEMPPLSAYGELPGIEDAAISPSGNRIAALVTVEGSRMLVAFNEENQAISSVNVDDTKVRSFQWIGEDRLLLIYSFTEDLGPRFTTDKHEFSAGLVLPIGIDAETFRIFERNDSLATAIFGNYGLRQIDGRWYGFFGAIEYERRGSIGLYQFRHGRPFLYRVDLQNGDTVRMARAAEPNNERDWLVDADGNVAVTYNLNRESGRWSIRGSSGTVIARGESENGRSGLIGLGRGGSSVLFLQTDDENRTLRFEMPLSGGEPTRFLPGIRLERLYFDRQTGYLTGYLEDGADASPNFDDPNHVEALHKVQAAFSEFDLALIDWSNNLEHFLVRTTGQTDSGSWYAVDVEDLSAHAFAYERVAIGPQQVGRFSTFEYIAQDGLELDGILTLPPGREANDLPVILLPHGGPHSYDSEQFDWWAQAFASRGYAVFQPNFRGSTHRGAEFRRAGYGEWGRKMQTDISDGLAALAEVGIVDPSRACIVGASYGGYAALAGVTLQQDLYRCAVAVAPVTDIRRMYQEDFRASGASRITRTSLREQLGDPETWNAVSPLRAAERADAPIMLIHGRDDTVVPYSHSLRMADALDDEDKSHVMVTLDGEDHWLSLSETRQRMLNAAVAFVQEHNPAD